jgi:ATP-dependent Clp protease ATP-binding subunit ClpC
LKSVDYNVKIDYKVIKFLSIKGYDKEYGARPIKRAIQKYLEDPLAKKIVNSEIKKGDKIEITHLKDAEILNIKVLKN